MCFPVLLLKRGREVYSLTSSYLHPHSFLTHVGFFSLWVLIYGIYDISQQWINSLLLLRYTLWSVLQELGCLPNPFLLLFHPIRTQIHSGICMTQRKETEPTPSPRSKSWFVLIQTRWFYFPCQVLVYKWSGTQIWPMRHETKSTWGFKEMSSHFKGDTGRSGLFSPLGDFHVLFWNLELLLPSY